ncbi:MAG: right-handed parallel beta-helix repeat-containing protein, partial [candidate division Zixibacteria bacterium]|nr:right-handed parallel beta-helix repeat-containing protein [candidate division Zixibacteria bacterium]
IHIPSDQPTIQAGINAAVDGDTVLVASGTYVENVNVNKSIVLSSTDGSAATLLIPNAPAVPVIAATSTDFQVQGLTVSGSKAQAAIYASRCFVRLSDIRVTACTTSYSPIYLWGNFERGSAYIENCQLDSNQGHLSGGICLMDFRPPCGSSAVVRSVFFRNSASYGGGITVWTCQNVTISRCIMRANAAQSYGGGIFCTNNSAQDSILNNTIVACSSYTENGGGIYLTEGFFSRNNIIVDCMGYGVRNYSPDHDYNDVWGNSPSNYINGDPGTHDISSDPLFMGQLDADFRLMWNSPCIDAGDPDSIYSDPDGTRNDMGAVYFDQAFPRADNVTVGEIGSNNVVDHEPTFSWSYFSPDSTPQIGYEIQVGSNNDWGETEMWQTGQVTGADSSCVYAGGNLQDGSTYYGRIRLYGLYGGVQWGAWREFVFRMNSVPTLPQMRLPLPEGIAPSQQPSLIIRNSTDAENDSLIYTFEVSPDNFAATVFTFTKKQDADSLTTLVVDSTLVENTQYWWRVKASDYYESSDFSPVRSFYVNSANTAPTAVSLLQPANTAITPIVILRPQFVWTPSTDPDPLDSITYDLVIAIDSNFLFVQQIPNLSATSHTLTSDLLWGMRYWWKVKSADRPGAFNWSPVFIFRTMTLGDANNDGAVDISDAVYLIAYIFSGGPAPPPLLAGDANCDSTVDISDVVYLIAYIFSGGSAPCSAF